MLPTQYGVHSKWQHPVINSLFVCQALSNIGTEFFELVTVKFFFKKFSSSRYAWLSARYDHDMDECVYPGTHWSEDNGSTSTATIIHSAYERNEVNGPLTSASSAIASTPLPPIDELQDEFQSTPIIRANRKRKPSTQDSSSDEESICQCPICFENWTNFGSHRIVSMKCGHLFGLR